MAAINSRSCPIRAKDILQRQVRELSRLLLGKMNGENIWNMKNAPDDWPDSLTWKNPTTSPKDSMTELEEKFLYLRSKTKHLLTADQVRMYELYDGNNATDLAGLVASDTFLKVCEKFLNTEIEYVPLGKANEIIILLKTIICKLKDKKVVQTDTDMESTLDSSLIHHDNHEQIPHTFSKEFDACTVKYSPPFHDQDVKFNKQSHLMVDNRNSTGEILHSTKRNNTSAFDNQARTVKNCKRKKLQSESPTAQQVNFGCRLIYTGNNNELSTRFNKPSMVITNLSSALYTDINTQSSTDITTQSPTDITTQSPTDITTQSPTDITTQSPTDITTQSPIDINTQSPTDITTQSPIYITTHLPTDITTQPSTDITTQLPTDINSPSHIYSNSPSHIYPSSPLSADIISDTSTGFSRGVYSQLSTHNTIHSFIDSNNKSVETFNQFANINNQFSVDLFSQPITDSSSFTPISQSVTDGNSFTPVSQSVTDGNSFTPVSQSVTDGNSFTPVSQSVTDGISFTPVSQLSSSDCSVESNEHQEELSLCEDEMSNPSTLMLLEEIISSL
ncbi:hypothetical protein Btru_013351 [Bulinus truncatus]|nr:hypothetical protein Btru_013351 [Bulinus truncatus]